jgi:ATP/maltotriose-dependent transcriptional regulator MalT
LQVALRIMSELEAELLQHKDMEGIITLIKTVPPKWGQEKLRCVLSDALCHTWDGEEAAMYACSKQAETVREAVDRTDRMRTEAADLLASGVSASPAPSFSVSRHSAGQRWEGKEGEGGGLKW